MSKVTEGTPNMDEPQLASLQPGGLLHYDYRSATAKERKLSDQLRVVQWNIERGIQFDRIVETLRALPADILILQELDINCKRSNYRNVPRELAEALQMQIYFVCEFEELDAVDRPLEHAVGPLSSTQEKNEDNHHFSSQEKEEKEKKRHFHGNAILSASATLTDAFVIPHTCGIDWEKEGWKLHEPRHGFRSVLRCCIQPHSRTNTLLPNLYVYCCHFEVFCGTLARVRQLLDIFRDMNSILEKENTKESRESFPIQPLSLHNFYSHPAFIIGGDFNTMADGIVRFSSRYGTDRMRFFSIGEKEACWLQRKVLSRYMNSITRGCCPFSYRFPSYIISLLYDWICNSYLVWRWVYGFNAEEIAFIDNRHLCLYDMSDKALSITLDHPAYHGFVRGKLDWLLLSNMKVLSPQYERRNEGNGEKKGIQILEENGSITAETASYLLPNNNNNNNNNNNKKEGEISKLIPRDGYILFNEKFEASDHKGLLLHVKQHLGMARDVYPAYGAIYTSSWTHLGFFLCTRAVPLATVGWFVWKRFGQ